MRYHHGPSSIVTDYLLPTLPIPGVVPRINLYAAYATTLPRWAVGGNGHLLGILYDGDQWAGSLHALRAFADIGRRFRCRWIEGDHFGPSRLATITGVLAHLDLIVGTLDTPHGFYPPVLAPIEERPHSVSRASIQYGPRLPDGAEVIVCGRRQIGRASPSQFDHGPHITGFATRDTDNPLDISSLSGESGSAVFVRFSQSSAWVSAGVLNNWSSGSNVASAWIPWDS